METLPIRTNRREEMIDITREIARLVEAKGWKDGVVLLHCPHTTAGLTINEAADPSVARDLTMIASRIAPRDAGYAHAEGNSDAHAKSSLFGPQLLLIVENGRLALGTWQGVFFCEGDGPRSRKIWMKWLPDRE